MTRPSTTLEPVDWCLDVEVLERSVTGYGITEPATVRSVLAGSRGDEAICLLVFLRHFG